MAEKTDPQTEQRPQRYGTVENKAPRPAGLLPKNAQQLVILGVAVVMVLIMWLSGGSKRTRLSTPAVPPAAEVEAPNPATVEAFKQAIQQQQAAAREPISQANLERLKALRLAGDVPPGNVVPPPADAATPQPGGIVGTVANQPPPDPIKEDKKKRAYLSLFASNVAFTGRDGLAAAQLSGAESKTVNPRLQDDPEQHQIRLDTQHGESGPQIPGLNPTEPGQGQGSTPASPSDPIQQTGRLRRSNPNLSPPGAFNSFTGKRYVVFEGTILETVLINRLNGTFSGPVNCLVTTDLYSHDRQHILIPAGTNVLGEAKKVNAFNQQRLAVFFHRLIMPDGYSVTLDQFKGLSQTGETALRDKVNNHYFQIFGASLAVGILGGVAEAGTGNVLTNSPFDRAREGFGASVANSSMNILDRFLNLLPTVTIREGYRVKVYFSGDLLLPDYAEHTMPPDL